MNSANINIAIITEFSRMETVVHLVDDVESNIWVAVVLLGCLTGGLQRHLTPILLPVVRLHFSATVLEHRDLHIAAATASREPPFTRNVLFCTSSASLVVDPTFLLIHTIFSDLCFEDCRLVDIKQLAPGYFVPALQLRIDGTVINQFAIISAFAIATEVLFTRSSST
jgi:hypothetical protein